jgi:hypothetical protein
MILLKAASLKELGATLCKKELTMRPVLEVRAISRNSTRTIKAMFKSKRLLVAMQTNLSMVFYKQDMYRMVRCGR